MKRLLIIIFCMALLIPPGIQFKTGVLAQDQAPLENQGDDDWFVTIDFNNTPLAKEIEKKHNEQGGKDKRDREWKEKNNKTDFTGHLVETETIIEYDDAEGYPEDSGGKGKTQGGLWKSIKMKPEKKENKDWKTTVFRPGTYNKTMDQTGPKVYSAFLPNTDDNDDDDCLDLATGKHLQGKFDDSGGTITGCFLDPDNDRRLGQTLELVSGDDGPVCKHKEDPNVVFSIEECDARDMTTLVETIDEDGEDDLDFDGDGNIDPDNGINDDGDCMDNSGTYYPSNACTDENGNYLDGKYPLIDEDGEGPIDNDGDGQIDEDPPGDKDKPGSSETFKDQCKGFYKQVESQLGMQAGELFSEEDLNNSFNDSTGECDFDNALIKGINKKSDKEHGKHVFKDPKDPNPAKEKWDDSESMSGKTVSYTFPIKGNYTIVLTITDKSGNEESCNQKWKVDDKGVSKEIKSDCPSGSAPSPVADFSVSCTDLTCDFDASSSSGEELSYDWSIGKKAAGDHGKSQEDKEAFEKGKERRKVTVTETMLVRCKPGWIYEEAPGPDDAKKVRCRKITPVLNATGQGDLVNVAGSLGLQASQSHLLSPSNKAMMGMTFAPPVIEWGWKIEEEVCIFGWCFEIFYARVGYEFDIAAGLRLPVQMDVDVSDTNWPDNVWAEERYNFTASLTPLDFDKQDYIQFCNDHNLDDEWYISDCDRFSFPNFMDETDGDEFVAYYEVFAGLIVRVLEIPLISWGIDSSMDLAQTCTLWNALMNLQEPDLQDLAQLGTAIANGEMADTLKDMGIMCGSFTTPFGFDEDGEARTFPFPTFSKAIRADCAEAIVRNEIIYVGGEPVPLCTGLIVGISGASLGMGVELTTNLTSHHICANWGAGGDAARQSTGPPYDCKDILYGLDRDLDWAWENKDDPPPVVNIGPVIYDNYDLERGLAHDKGILQVDDFVYWLDINVSLYANLMFGGILSPIGTLDRIELYTFSFSDLGAKGFLPIPQHPGTEPLQLSVDVKNHGLDLYGSPDVSTAVLNSGQLEGRFSTDITNLGSLSGSFDDFRAELTNIPNQSAPYTFGRNADNDGDGLTNEDGPSPQACAANPMPPGCFFDDDGDGLVDEDPMQDAWVCQIGGVGATEWTCHSAPDQPLPLNLPPYGQGVLQDVLIVKPFQHSMTSPGLYPVKILGNSFDAQGLFDNPRFPGDESLYPYYYNPDDHEYGRLDVFDIAFVEVKPFADPRVIVRPPQDGGKPGVMVSYQGSFVNGGNEKDSMTVTTEMIDFNQANCTLTTLGTQPGCPYRAVPTGILESWYMDGFSNTYSDLDPARYEEGTFTVSAPRDWAGMQDTTYEFEVTAQSHKDLKVTNTYLVNYTVQATKESMTRYIGLEIDELIQEIEAANTQGVQTCGLKPITIHPIKLQYDRALDLILNGGLDQASKPLSAGAYITDGAFLHALAGCKKIPADLQADWQQRGEAILADFTLARDSMVASAP